MILNVLCCVFLSAIPSCLGVRATFQRPENPADFFLMQNQQNSISELRPVTFDSRSAFVNNQQSQIFPQQLPLPEPLTLQNPLALTQSRTLQQPSSHQQPQTLQRSSSHRQPQSFHQPQSFLQTIPNQQSFSNQLFFNEPPRIDATSNQISFLRSQTNLPLPKQQPIFLRQSARPQQSFQQSLSVKPPMSLQRSLSNQQNLFQLPPISNQFSNFGIPLPEVGRTGMDSFNTNGQIFNRNLGNTNTLIHRNTHFSNNFQPQLPRQDLRQDPFFTRQFRLPQNQIITPNFGFRQSQPTSGFSFDNIRSTIGQNSLPKSSNGFAAPSFQIPNGGRLGFGSVIPQVGHANVVGRDIPFRSGFSGFSGSSKPPSPGPCPVVPVVKNFQQDLYLGRWFEIQRFPAPFQNGDCVTADYSLNSNCTIQVLNSETRRDGTFNSREGVATSATSPSLGSLVVNFENDLQFNPNNNEANYNVVSTDYRNYAVVYSCSMINLPNLGEVKAEFSWVLSRAPQMDPVFLSRLEHWLTQVNIDASRYEKTRQDHTCVYGPFL